jgi:hypothetical protein
MVIIPIMLIRDSLDIAYCFTEGKMTKTSKKFMYALWKNGHVPSTFHPLNQQKTGKNIEQKCL